MPLDSSYTIFHIYQNTSFHQGSLAAAPDFLLCRSAAFPHSCAQNIQAGTTAVSGFQFLPSLLPMWNTMCMYLIGINANFPGCSTSMYLGYSLIMETKVFQIKSKDSTLSVANIIFF